VRHIRNLQIRLRIKLDAPDQDIDARPLRMNSNGGPAPRLDGMGVRLGKKKAARAGP